jgi:DNA-binding response OmpR family regulator
MANILVIEDDDIMLKAIRNILGKDGYNVITAKDGKEAFEKLEGSEYDVVVTDLMMPYANGLEVVSKLRSDEMKRNVGIIVISSVGNEETITEAFRLGADDYLKKPIMAGELLIRIRKLLANKNSKSQLVTKKK